MTSAKHEHGFEFNCDECGEVIEPPRLGRGSASRDFRESWELAKDAGWRAFKGPRSDWVHKCPRCAYAV